MTPPSYQRRMPELGCLPQSHHKASCRVLDSVQPLSHQVTLLLRSRAICDSNVLPCAKFMHQGKSNAVVLGQMPKLRGEARLYNFNRSFVVFSDASLHGPLQQDRPQLHLGNEHLPQHFACRDQLGLSGTVSGRRLLLTVPIKRDKSALSMKV